MSESQLYITLIILIVFLLIGLIAYLVGTKNKQAASQSLLLGLIVGGLYNLLASIQDNIIQLRGISFLEKIQEEYNPQLQAAQESGSQDDYNSLLAAGNDALAKLQDSAMFRVEIFSLIIVAAIIIGVSTYALKTLKTKSEFIACAIIVSAITFIFFMLQPLTDQVYVVNYLNSYIDSISAQATGQVIPTLAELATQAQLSLYSFYDYLVIFANSLVYSMMAVFIFIGVSFTRRFKNYVVGSTIIIYAILGVGVLSIIIRNAITSSISTEIKNFSILYLLVTLILILIGIVLVYVIHFVVLKNSLHLSTNLDELDNESKDKSDKETIDEEVIEDLEAEGIARKEDRDLYKDAAADEDLEKEKESEEEEMSNKETIDQEVIEDLEAEGIARKEDRDLYKDADESSNNEKETKKETKKETIDQEVIEDLEAEGIAKKEDRDLLKDEDITENVDSELDSIEVDEVTVTVESEKK